MYMYTEVNDKRFLSHANSLNGDAYGVDCGIARYDKQTAKIFPVIALKKKTGT